MNVSNSDAKKLLGLQKKFAFYRQETTFLTVRKMSVISFSFFEI